MEKLAPIALFVYNRPDHTLQTLEALYRNKLSNESILYIFADGAKIGSDVKMLDNIRKTRDVIKSKLWCKDVIIIERNENLGLAKSIITGVSEIVNKYGKIIVLEDDILPCIGFLEYMNNALELYENTLNVGCIHAWNFYMDTTSCVESTFFLRGGDCWGWGTWSRSWQLFNEDSNYLLSEIRREKLEFEFDMKGNFKFLEMLEEQESGRINSWAIRWYASLFLKDMYCLHPKNPIVRNIGFDDSGENCGHIEVKQETVDYIKLEFLKVQQADWFYSSYAASVKLPPRNFWNKLFQKIKAISIYQ
jgi:hypothetical protein